MEDILEDILVVPPAAAAPSLAAVGRRILGRSRAMAANGRSCDPFFREEGVVFIVMTICELWYIISGAYCGFKYLLACQSQ